nr:acetoacetyl-coa synthetase [Quercus suber]
MRGELESCIARANTEGYLSAATAEEVNSLFTQIMFLDLDPSEPPVLEWTSKLLGPRAYCDYTMSNMSLTEEVWVPQLAGRTSMDKYRRHINSRFDQDLKTTADLQKWTCQDPQNFWMDLYTYLNFQPPLPRSITRAYDDRAPISANPLFFEGLSMNYAENAIFANPDPNAIALVGLREGMDLNDGEKLTWSQFREKVRATASALRRSGIQKGDRVAALVATGNWAMILFHASAAIGAIFTCVSPELGLEGCVSRLQQVTPKILFVDSDTVYKGKTVSTAEKLGQILERLVNKPLLFIVPITLERTSFETIDTFLAKARSDDKLEFTKVSFNDPLMICYSSGTTGTPKCIVHRHGILLQLKKISAIHNSTTPKDVILQYSSISWVVFYIMCGYFACGATTIVYNGSPMYPDVNHLLKMAAHFKVTYFGTSPRYLLEIEMAKVVPRNSFDLSALRIVYTTGATLSPEQYRWFYSSFPSSVHLCNTAGGTDTATSLIAADSCAPVRAGEMQVFALGMDVDVADPDSGASIMHTGEAGEMVIRKPFPSMPCFFWGDRGGKIYHESYFERFSNIDVWAQHDWLARNPRTGGYIMSGRSDGVLSEYLRLLHF